MTAVPRTSPIASGSSEVTAGSDVVMGCSDRLTAGSDAVTNCSDVVTGCSDAASVGSHDIASGASYMSGVIRHLASGSPYVSAVPRRAADVTSSAPAWSHRDASGCPDASPTRHAAAASSRQLNSASNREASRSSYMTASTDAVACSTAPAARVDTSPSFGPFLSERHARSAYRVLRGVKRFDVEKRFGFSRCIRVFLWSRIVAMILVGAISPSPCGEMTERCGRQPAARAYCVRHYCIARS